MIDLLLAATVFLSAKSELPEYRGSHHTPAAEKFLECVAARESGWPNKNSWTSDGPYGSGAFQMILVTSRRAALAINAPEWAEKRAYLWPPYLQTEAAYWLLNPFPKKPGLEGRHHWSSDHAKRLLGKNIHDCGR